MKDQKRIVVSYGKTRKIAKFFNVTDAMVSKALRGKSNTKLAKDIRQAAIDDYEGQKIILVSENKKL
ncbi:MAG: ArsR family transcriptional regulator [Bacteroidales bacterium]|jgi:predicted transcriptional regulator|nr:ArsR family transcriptional regulator [Bacteroidales bacterium]MCI2145928.1 ArsR family transcriptional regulator [Bacteroidales bacterium]